MLFRSRKGDGGLVGVSSIVSVGEAPSLKKQKSESASAEDCNDLIRFLKTKGLSDIAFKFSKQMRMSKVEDFMSLDVEDLEDPDLSFLKGWEKKKLIKLVAAGTAHSFSPGCKDQSNVKVDPNATTDSSTDFSGAETEDTDSDDDVALAVRNLGNLDDLVAHLKGFMGELIGEAKLREMGNDS